MGRKMILPEMYALLAILAVFAVYGVSKYSRAETSDYNAFVTKAQELQASYKSLEGRLDSMGKSLDAFDNLSRVTVAKCTDVQAEVSKMQEHLQIVKTDQIGLMDKLSRRRPVLRAQGPIQIEILPGKTPGKPVELKPDPDMFRRIKKQVKGLSK